MSQWLDPNDFGDMDLDTAHDLTTEVEALAIVVAPCLAKLDPDSEFYEVQIAALRAILRTVVTRWHSNDQQGGTDAVTLAAGPFSQTVQPQSRGNNIWPTEIKNLQKVCQLGSDDAGKAWSVDRVGSGHFDSHSGICSLWFGASYCSCMADINPEHTSLYPADHHAGHRAHMRPL